MNHNNYSNNSEPNQNTSENENVEPGVKKAKLDIDSISHPTSSVNNNVPIPPKTNAKTTASAASAAVPNNSAAVTASVAVPATTNSAVNSTNTNSSDTRNKMTVTPVASSTATAAATPAPTKKLPSNTAAMQQQIQAQLQAQLQQQLQAAAARGQQANITPEQIQAQAQAMVQAAAQAQAVVSAAKSRGDGLVPMNAQQITALSQIQAQAIVNARPQTALLASGTPTVDANGNPVQPTPAQIQHQIQLQAQALVHAHTQAQIAAGIYKGDGSTNTVTAATQSKGPAPTSTPVPSSLASVGTTTTTPVAVANTSSTNKGPASKPKKPMPSSNSNNPILPVLTSNQLSQQNALTKKQATLKESMIQKHQAEISSLRSAFQQSNLASAPSEGTLSQQESQLKSLMQKHATDITKLTKGFERELTEMHTEFRKQNAAAEYAGVKLTTIPNPTPTNQIVSANSTVAVTTPNSIVPNVASVTATSGMNPLHSMVDGSTTSTALITTQNSTAMSSTNINLQNLGESNTVVSATSPAFLEKLSSSLNLFWTDQLSQMRNLGKDKTQTEQDFKNHNDLPLARIKRIMKSDEDVRMISAEAPVLFAKACEMFILELTLRSWSYSENNKRRTLQKEDIREAIQRTDIFDFLVDVIH